MPIDNTCSIGYPHDGRADNAAYQHDRRADSFGQRDVIGHSLRGELLGVYHCNYIELKAENMKTK